MSEPTGTHPEGVFFSPREGRRSGPLLPSEEPQPNWFWALICVGATCVSTWFVGAVHWKPIEYLTNRTALWPVLQANWPKGLLYMAAIMGILGMHELGHFLATRRHRIPASYPYFLPLPVVPFGTLGAVIGLADTQANRRQLLDLAVAGPLAGLIIAIPVAWIGLESLPGPPSSPSRGVLLQPPLLLQWLLQWRQPEWAAQPGLPLDSMNPWLMAAWVVLWITGLNLLPIGQLDGGHVVYALLARRAHWVARTLLLAAIGYILIAERYEWVLMVVLLCFLGVDHPPTAQDELPLDGKRRGIGWMVALLPIVCFTPQPVCIG
jgi:membrane-associated protease RseP (regulator of RpoE activity)